ncbi:MAG: sulfatase-like hydrolase/transferase [Halioglobus sp.]
MKNSIISILRTIAASSVMLSLASTTFAKDIVHDAEYYVIEAQNGERWRSDDKVIDQKLADFRKRNNNKPPNIIYILLDDLGFGEIGMPGLDVIRGYSTPHINKLASQGMSLQRMYTEPSCTPTRVAMMTGRLPIRTGINEAKVTLTGEGLPAAEVTLAEVLAGAGYNTSHIGKWHMGDIEQSFANNQGFQRAEFPIHQQAQLALMNPQAEQSDITRGLWSDGSFPDELVLDQNFTFKAGDMLTGVELRDGKLYEVDLKPGENWTQQKYEQMNARYQTSVMRELKDLAAQDEPFFLNYWPLYPVTFDRRQSGAFRTRNGGSFTEAIMDVDDWIGDIMSEVDRLGISENTIIMVMGDNGTMTNYMGLSGASDRIYRGGKGEHLEGGVRVNAYIRWPSMIEPGSMAEDIVHVSDVYTSMARLAGATDEIPRDRVVDGVDQSGMLLLGETHGRRDYVYIYEQNSLKSIVKNKYKFHLAPPMTNPILSAGFYDLYRDPREERWDQGIKMGTWASGQFSSMLKRHKGLKKKYPDRKPITATPYEGVENLRPETQRMVDAFLSSKKSSR